MSHEITSWKLGILTLFVTTRFLSIDCGSESAPYSDPFTTIMWEGDDKYATDRDEREDERECQ